jgi:hypothetical protein
VITGEFTDGSEYSGYTRSKDGKIKTFAVPESGGTFPESINANGDVAGEVYDTDFSRVHGFLRVR